MDFIIQKQMTLIFAYAIRLSMPHFIIQILMLLFLATSANAGEIFKIGVPCSAVLDESSFNALQCKSVESEAVLREAYSRAGYDVEFVYMPWKRLLVAANSGKIAGCSIRTKESLENSPHLVCLPTPLLEIKANAYALNPKVRINSTDDLIRYNVGVRLGDAMSSNVAKKYAKNVSFAYDFKQLTDLVSMGRVDAIIVNDGVGRKIVKQFGENYFLESKPLVTKYLYHVLNKKYASIAGTKLDNAFREMIEDGTFKRLAGSFADMIPDKSALANLKDPNVHATNQRPGRAPVSN